MRRRLFNLAAAVSLLLCLAIIGQWIRSYWFTDAWMWDTLTSRRSIATIGGAICYIRSEETKGQMRFMDKPGFYSTPTIVPVGGTPIPPDWTFAGFKATHVVVGSWRGFTFAVPFWPVVVLTAVAALGLLSGHSGHRRRSQEPVCNRCGYNLTGNISGICPECGTPVAGRR